MSGIEVVLLLVSDLASELDVEGRYAVTQLTLLLDRASYTLNTIQDIIANRLLNKDQLTPDAPVNFSRTG